jgi:Cysteine-rich secretory protein family
MKNALSTMILILFAVLLGFQIQACDSDDDDTVGGISSDDDDDDNDNADDDDDDSTGTNECGTYGSSSCTDGDSRACESADLSNQDRYENPEESDCAPNLQWSEALAAVALAHSKDMCDRSFFDHVNPDGTDPFERMTAAGIDWVSAGENLAYGTNMSAQQANDLWMDEPVCEHNHRSNLLSRNFTHIGVGVYDCGPNVYFTQDFATFSFDDLPSGTHPECGSGF